MRKEKYWYLKRAVALCISMMVCFSVWLFWSFIDDGFMFSDGGLNIISTEIEILLIILWFYITTIVIHKKFCNSNIKDTLLVVGLSLFWGFVFVLCNYLIYLGGIDSIIDSFNFDRETNVIEGKRAEYKEKSEVIYDISFADTSIYFDVDNMICYWIDFTREEEKQIFEINMIESRITKEELINTYQIAYEFMGSNNAMIYLVKENLEEFRFVERIYIDYNGKLYVGGAVECDLSRYENQMTSKYQTYKKDVSKYLRNIRKNEEQIFEDAESVYDFGNDYEKIVLDTNDSVMYYVTDSNVETFWVQKRQLNLDDFIFLKLSKEIKSDNGIIKVYEYKVSEIWNVKIQVLYWLYNGENYYIISDNVLFN